MDLTKIITVAGKPGLHRVVAQGRQALIVESLLDNKRFPVPMSVKVSSLEEISMFTTGDDVLLKDVLTKLYEVTGGGAAADPKSDDGALWAELLKALPTADKDRIYASDVRKLFTWYAQLLKAGEFAKKEDAKEEKAEVKEEAKPKKATTKKAKAGTAAKAPKASGASGPPKAAAVRRGGQRGS
ncbi:MAG: DUF5606 domain-containing protein [Flavobacteriales bacterium]|nr:DUF5606 domain-containing protein [Flavobacteriales bacterium]